MSDTSKKSPPVIVRADELLVSLGEAESRTLAQRLIREGKVLRKDGQIVTKPSQKLPAEESLSVTSPPRFVSRGGEKLEAWFDDYPLDLTGSVALDVGSSTGGFTDCLLQRGALEVTGVDVGHGQLHPRLNDDHRVTNIEGVNARELESTTLPHLTYPLVVADLSFISLRKVLGPIWQRVAPDGVLILLVKPQFEAAREVVAKSKGIIRDEAIRHAALTGVIDEALALSGAKLIGQKESPIAGGDGNREFLIGLRRC